MPSVGTVVVALVILLIAGLAARSVVKRQRGGGCPGCDKCGGCPQSPQDRGKSE
ncbi:MAG: FeoB-associated Cys-rich membrane protein [Oscillospiraceae bacterium]|nr:FeoB-associated Cys-rich membrane protein [Oscillospiraceae bacterium]